MRYSRTVNMMNLRKLPLKGLGYRYLSTFKADKYYVFRTLGLEAFSDIELRKSYAEVFSRDSKGDLELGLKSLLTKKEKANTVNTVSSVHDDVDIDEKVRQIAAYLTAKEKKGSSFNPFHWGAAAAQKDEEKTEKKDETRPVSSLHPSLSFEEYKSRLRGSAEQLDPRLPAVVVSALLTGVSIGVIIPCMPILVQTIGMPPSEFGLVVAAFGISKMFGNIPSAYFVETYGRKPVMVAGLVLCGLGIGGIGLTLVDGFGTPWLIGCRLVSGLGVSAFTGGTFMLLSDISTSLNRTRTPASVMAGFQSGTALGPALGGLMVNGVGIGPTYFTVGGLFAVMASLNHMFLAETMPGKTLFQKRADEKKAEERMALLKAANPTIEVAPTAATAAPILSVTKPKTIADVGIAGSFRVALLSWKELMKKRAVRDVMFIHGSYWAAIAGTQMTLLPLMMVGPTLHLGASEIGMTFAFISMTGVAASQPVAYLADRHGKLNCMLGGCALVSAAMALIPMADSWYYILAASVPLSIGSTTMGASPIALVTDLVSKEDRAQALALLRTSSDVGFLVGATAGGLIADVFSIETAISGYSALMAGATVWFAFHTVGVKGLGTIFGLGDKEVPVGGVKEGKDVAVEYDMTAQPAASGDGISAVVAVSDTHKILDRITVASAVTATATATAAAVGASGVTATTAAIGAVGASGVSAVSQDGSTSTGSRIEGESYSEGDSREEAAANMKS